MSTAPAISEAKLKHDIARLTSTDAEQQAAVALYREVSHDGKAGIADVVAWLEKHDATPTQREAARVLIEEIANVAGGVKPGDPPIKQRLDGTPPSDETARRLAVTLAQKPVNVSAVKRLLSVSFALIEPGVFNRYARHVFADLEKKGLLPQLLSTIASDPVMLSTVVSNLLSNEMAPEVAADAKTIQSILPILHDAYPIEQKQPPYQPDYMMVFGQVAGRLIAAGKFDEVVKAYGGSIDPIIQPLVHASVLGAFIVTEEQEAKVQVGQTAYHAHGSGLFDNMSGVSDLFYVEEVAFDDKGLASFRLSGPTEPEYLITFEDAGHIYAQEIGVANAPKMELSESGIGFVAAVFEGRREQAGNATAISNFIPESGKPANPFEAVSGAKWKTAAYGVSEYWAEYNPSGEDGGIAKLDLGNGYFLACDWYGGKRDHWAVLGRAGEGTTKPFRLSEEGEKKFKEVVMAYRDAHGIN